jgi:hypothetical protein
MLFWCNTVAPVKYRIVKDLLYPATLGSALAWFVQAFQRWLCPPLAADGAAAVPVPSAWSLCFAAWFLVCFGAW